MPIVSAWLLTIMFYLYFRFQMKLDPLKTVQVSLFFFMCLIYGLTSGNKKFCAIILLCLPFLATNRGRGILIFNCYEIAASEILPNIEKNIHFLEIYYECNRKVIKGHTTKLVKNSDAFQNLIKTGEDFKFLSRKIKTDLSNKRQTIKKKLENLEFDAGLNLTNKINKLAKLFESCRKFQDEMVRKCNNTMDTFFIWFSFTFVSEIMQTSFCQGKVKNESLCDRIKKELNQLETKTAENWDELVDKRVS